ncbi:purine-nucleoside phosphorylase [Salicibibacter halophilus]|uniref:Purine nucleoside phosphorylase n=1 Tax=Salicibibacter halophilus TaxID=2502791 RepID=A0A514LN00_9BACI|nr:purine-nucleoside phosphorylase [Salicibibacter halophilus]QDI92935.1 purine-nucleoside phosphorylase [Salicibibacter halophilus]
MNETVKNAIDLIKKKTTINPAIAVTLGSGLGGLADNIKAEAVIRYEDIPGFPASTVSGHAGEFVIGHLKEVPVIAMKGRFHYYEGYPMQKVVLPTRVISALGVKTLIVSNAAGGVNTSYSPGDLMVIKDHINQMGDHPLIGPNDEKIGPRFPDMSAAYDKRMMDMAHEEAKAMGLQLQSGVYAATTGPTYETPAEVRMFRTLGADAVGMSTVPEVIAASHAGVQVLGISCISNAAAGILDQPLSHEEVIETTERVKTNFTELVTRIILRMETEERQS